MIYTPAAFLLLLTVSSSIASAALGRGHGAFLRRQAQDSDCRCGYSKDGVIFPKRFSIDFTSAQTPEAITAAGMYVTDSFDWQVGEVAPDGTTGEPLTEGREAGQMLMLCFHHQPTVKQAMYGLPVQTASLWLCPVVRPASSR